MNTSSPAVRRLSLALRIVGGGFIVFYAVAAVVSATGTELTGVPHDTLQWGHNRRPEEIMLAAVYLPWGAFLWIAARDPLKYELFIAFTVAANALHAATMWVQGALIEGEAGHMVGDAPLLAAVTLGLVAAWLPARREAAERVGP